MRITLTELRKQICDELIVAECRLILERETSFDKAEKIGDLVRMTLKDPYKVNDLFTYLRKVGTPNDMMQQLLTLMKKNNRVEVVAASRDLACDIVGARPSMTGDGKPDECKPRHKQGKRAQMMNKVKGFFKRKNRQ